MNIARFRGADLGGLAAAKNAQVDRPNGELLFNLEMPEATCGGGSNPGTRGWLRRGVEFLRIHKTTDLYVGMKTHYGIGLSLEGQSLSRVDGKDHLAKPGTLQLKQPNQVHRDLRRDAPGTFQLIMFDEELIHGALEDDAPTYLDEVIIDGADASNDADAFRRLHAAAFASSPDSFAVDVAVTEAIATFASRLRRRGGGPRSDSALRMHARVRRARDFLLEHLSEQVTLDAVADHAGTDKFHLCRAFTAELGMPPYAFLTQARIARAKILLRKGLRPSDLAPLLGFCDQSQMHRHFVKIVGCTPGEFARSC